MIQVISLILYLTMINSKRILQLETQLFESLKSARQKYSQKLSSRKFDSLVRIDPSKTFKYIEQLCNYYFQGAKLQNLEKQIKIFDTLSSKNLIKSKDINYFKSYSQFEQFVNEHSGSMSKSEERKLIKTKGTEVVYNSQDILVLLIEDEQASIQYGSGTKWCISATDSKNYFKPYRDDLVTFYFVFQKNLSSSDPSYKIAVAVYPDGKIECYNAEDTLVSFSLIQSLGLNISLFVPISLSQKEILNSIVRNGSYNIDSNGVIEVFGDVDISFMNLNSILKDIGNFGTVTGNFDCSENKLISLEGSPSYVGGSFLCQKNKLETLEYCPKNVGLNFYCFGNNLKNLQHSPKTVGLGFFAYSNYLTSINNSTNSIGKDFDIRNNHNLEDLSSLPKEILGKIILKGTKAENIYGDIISAEELFFWVNKYKNTSRK